MSATFHIKTYGCQMNERDSESIGSLLVRHGYAEAGDESQADIVIVNTCSVREKAEDKALGKLGLLTAPGSEQTGRVVGAIGCMVERLGRDIFGKVPALDFAVGTHRLHRVPAVLDLVFAGEKGVLDVGIEGSDERVVSGHSVSGPSAFVNILLGCNRGCSYCVVPRVRGQEWSRPAEAVLEEVSEIAAAGVKEVTLLGQSVMSYGRSNDVWPGDHVSPRGYGEPLAKLLEAVDQIDGIERVRFTSGHPSGCTAELARAMAELPAVCEHLHLPVQSGSDRILTMMGRGYTADGYADAVERVRSGVPSLAITTDVIVGFPSETVQDFEMTRSLMDKIGFDNSFIFKYSPRPDTPAGRLTDDVPVSEKMRRNQVLLADQERRGLALNGQMAGKTVEVLVEGVSLRNSRRWSGRTRTNKIVVFEPLNGMAVGDLAMVDIERAMPQTLYGRPLS
jgi:tRNA-2-methylthio-N6-dimethylallyladenosine synthase